ncbi:MAG: molecular chaperone TorD family protein, partial [Halodesulfurarchaeum sp.]
LGEPLAVVKDTYTDLGIAPAPDLKEEADHAAVELAVLRELSANGKDRKSDFLAAHGDWFDALADDVREAAEEPFYEAIADLVGGLIAFDAEREGIER